MRCMLIIDCVNQFRVIQRSIFPIGGEFVLDVVVFDVSHMVFKIAIVADVVVVETFMPTEFMYLVCLHEGRQALVGLQCAPVCVM